MTGNAAAFWVLGGLAVVGALAAVLAPHAVHARLGFAACATLAALLVGLVDAEWWLALALLALVAVPAAALAGDRLPALAPAVMPEDAGTTTRAGLDRARLAAAAALLPAVAVITGALATRGHLAGPGGATGFARAVADHFGVPLLGVGALLVVAGVAARSLGHLDPLEARHLAAARDRRDRADRERRRREDRLRAQRPEQP